jgi:hypothetical protein
MRVHRLRFLASQNAPLRVAAKWGAGARFQRTGAQLDLSQNKNFFCDFRRKSDPAPRFLRRIAQLLGEIWRDMVFPPKEIPP